MLKIAEKHVFQQFFLLKKTLRSGSWNPCSALVSLGRSDESDNDQCRTVVSSRSAESHR